MASTAHRTEEEVTEHFDSAEVVASKVAQLAKWVKASKHFVVFTGAGISTSAGIPDFRGPNGVWTLRKQGKAVNARHHEMLGVSPTSAHMIIKGMCDTGILKHVISTNTDGIHRRSGVSSSHLTEIHGNTNEEDCPVEPIGATEQPYAGGGCGEKFFRDERCRREGLGSHEHATGRSCPTCGKDLQDTIINFDENLRHANVQRARDQAKRADVMLVIGSSLRVSSWAAQIAADNPNAKLIVCNLQWTPFNERAADLVIHARSDELMCQLAKALVVEQPAFAVRRRMRVATRPAVIEELPIKTLKGELERVEKGASKGCIDKCELTTKLIERGCIPFWLQIDFENGDGRPLAVMRHAAAFVAKHTAVETRSGTLEASCTLGLFPAGQETLELQIRLSAHFDEPVLTLHHPVGATAGSTATYDLSYEPGASTWSAMATVTGDEAGKSNASQSMFEAAQSSVLGHLRKLVGAESVER